MSHPLGLGQPDWSEVWEKSQEAAWEEFEQGELNDTLAELVQDDPMDCLLIALGVCFPKLRGESTYSHALKDFTATIKKAVEERAEELNWEEKESILNAADSDI